MGIVYRARDPRLDRIVAIKFLSGVSSLDPARRLRFLREARAEAALSHPNIATILDVGETEFAHPDLAPTSGGWSLPETSRVPYLVLEFVPGEDLRMRLKGEPPTPSEVLRLARQILDGLAAAHAKGIVHRDLKPANIRITPDGLVKILDFGLARFLRPDPPAGDEPTDLSTHDGVVLGTVPYLAPEQAAGMAVDARADLFSFGVILYQLVAGHLPFRGESSIALLRAVLNEAPLPIGERAAIFPTRLARLVEGLLAKEPEKRPQSAAEVRQELADVTREMADERTSVTKPTLMQLPTLPTEPRRPTWRRRLAPAAGLVALAAVAATIAVLRRPTAAPAPPVVSLQQIAVLPFVNSTGDTSLDYLADGLSSALVGRLAAAPGISVAAQSETRRYRGGVAGAREVAKELGVGTVMEATLRPDSAGLGLDAALTDGSTGRVFWSRSFTAPRDAPQKLAADVAPAAVAALSVPLSPADRERLARDPTGSAVAFDFYLRGKSADEDYDDPQAHRIAAGLFERATELDPQFTLAFAACADALVQAWQEERDPKLLDRAEGFARRALELDGDLAEARLASARVELLRGRPQDAIRLLEPLAKGDRVVEEIHRQLAEAWEAAGNLGKAEEHLLAMVSARPNWWASWNLLGDFRIRAGDYAGARSALEHARELEPEGQHIPDENLASLLLFEGRTEEALAAYEAIPGSPSSATTASNLGTLYFFNERFADAERQFRLAVRLAPRDARWRRNLADTLLRLHRDTEARQEYSQALRLVDQQLAVTPTDVDLRRQRTLYLARAGRCDDAVASADQLERELPATADLLHDLARAPALCGHPAEALARLERAVALGFTASRLADEDELAPLRELPEFRALVAGG